MDGKTKSNILAISICILAIQLVALWGVDISTSAMLNDAVVTNGFFVGDPVITYHLGLYILILTSFLQVSIVVHVVVGGKKNG